MNNHQRLRRPVRVGATICPRLIGIREDADALSSEVTEFTFRDGVGAQHRDNAELPDHIDTLSEREGFRRGGCAPCEVESREKVWPAFDKNDVWKV
jgi:hypothetical protein